MVYQEFLFFLVAIVLPDLYLDNHYLRKNGSVRWWHHLLWWMPTILMSLFTIALVTSKTSGQSQFLSFNIYLLVLSVLVVPKALFAISVYVGGTVQRAFRHRRNYGVKAGVVMVMMIWYVVINGTMIGVRQINVVHKTLSFKDLPEQFDGYKIVQITDLHLGTYNITGSWQLKECVDSINAQHADAVAFTGDIENQTPSEIEPFLDVLSSIKAKDGVFSVLGNHDYGTYLRDNSDKNCHDRLCHTVQLEQKADWTVLRNSHVTLRRGNDSIIIAGGENGGNPPFANYFNLRKTLYGVSPHHFVVMLQHDPSAWERDILPRSKVQLTLSGHTHGGQFSLFGLRPTNVSGKKDLGLYDSNGRLLYVSAGIGALVPFRFGVKPEITILTLHRL